MTENDARSDVRMPTTDDFGHAAGGSSEDRGGVSIFLRYTVSFLVSVFRREDGDDEESFD